MKNKNKDVKVDDITKLLKIPEAPKASKYKKTKTWAYLKGRRTGISKYS